MKGYTITGFNGRKGTDDLRGSSSDRKIRKQWLLDGFGNGIIAFCAFHGCTEELTHATLTVDRYPVPGCEGGRYIRGNIRPACSRCNTKDGSDMGHRRKKEKKEENV